MDPLSLIAVAVALAMDAFAVALATGLGLPRLTSRHLFRFGFHFGLFQGLMPILGWLAGLKLRIYIEAYDHWLAFILLGFVGVKMIREAFDHDTQDNESGDPTRGMSLVLLSVATSIDALAVGLSISLLGISIWTPALVIGITAAILTVCGMLLGRRLGAIWGQRVEFLGGLLLIAIGVKILIEHTFLN